MFLGPCLWYYKKYWETRTEFMIMFWHKSWARKKNLRDEKKGHHNSKTIDNAFDGSLFFARVDRKNETKEEKKEKEKILWSLSDRQLMVHTYYGEGCGPMNPFIVIAKMKGDRKTFIRILSGSWQHFFSFVCLPAAFWDIHHMFIFFGILVALLRSFLVEEKGRWLWNKQYLLLKFWIFRRYWRKLLESTIFSCINFKCFISTDHVSEFWIFRL